jgi:hypothetical protein
LHGQAHPKKLKLPAARVAFNAMADEFRFRVSDGPVTQPQPDAKMKTPARKRDRGSLVEHGGDGVLDQHE